jgi:hypothetical protein
MNQEGCKNIKGNASQYYVAAELSRRGMVAALTLGNCPNTDILCSDPEGKHFAHVQVKTFRAGVKKCAVGKKAQRKYSTRFFWVLVGIPEDQEQKPVYYIIPARIMARHVAASFKVWLSKEGKDKPHDPNNPFRAVRLPPHRNLDGWSIKKYKGRWDKIEKKLSSSMPPILIEVLQAIERNFHAVILDRAGDIVGAETLTLPTITFPLKPSQENESKRWFDIPSMHGGFAYWFKGKGADIKLICESWSRVVEGSGQRHEITTSGSKLVAEGFV